MSYMTDFRNRRDKRRAARDEAQIEDYNARAERARNERRIRSERSRYIDTIPGLSSAERAAFHHSGHTRANAAGVIPGEYAARLADYDKALATGARSINDYYLTRNTLDRDTAATQYLPNMLSVQVKQGKAKAKADNALAAQRNAEATDTLATLPSRIDSTNVDNALKALGAAGVEAGELVPPGFDETSRPAPMNDLDESRARNLNATTAKIVNELVTKPKSEATRLRAQTLERILARDSDASSAEKDWARQELKAMAARLAEEGESAVRVAEDSSGRKVYEIAPGVWVYEDGSAYEDAEQRMDEILKNMQVD